MNELEQIKKKSKSFSKIIILEFAYATFIYSLYKILSIKDSQTYWLYISILFIPSLMTNIYLYLKYKKNADFVQSNNILVIQILLAIFSFKFLV
jgi:hypothetical protein